MKSKPPRGKSAETAIFAGDRAGPSQMRLRWAFLGAVGEVCPAAIKDLRALVPLADDLPAQLEFYPVYPPEPQTEDVRERRPRELLEWAAKYNLVEADASDPWILRTAVRTVTEFSILQGVRGASLKLTFKNVGLAFYTTSQPLQVQIPEWEPQEEVAAAFRRRARQTFELEMETYIESQTGRLETAGLRATHEKKEPQHLVWLARYQVLGESVRSIARTLPDSGAEVSLDNRSRTLRREISSTAHVLGLRLRPRPKGGRPPKRLKPR